MFVMISFGRGSTQIFCGSKSADNPKKNLTQPFSPRLTRRGCTTPQCRHSRMSDESVTAAALATRSNQNGPSTLVFYVAVICLIWYVVVTLVSTLGYVQV